MYSQVCRELNNYFEYDKVFGRFEIIMVPLFCHNILKQRKEKPSVYKMTNTSELPVLYSMMVYINSLLLACMTRPSMEHCGY
jgi:hypothetical protein